MASEWQEMTVADLQSIGKLLVEDGNHGEYRPRSDEFVEDGVAFIRAADMESGRILFETASRINETAVRRIRKGIGAPGDILLSHKGTVGKIAIAPQDAPPFVCSPQTTFWRTLDNQFLDRKFLLYFIQSDEFRRQLNSRKSETDMADYVSLTSQRTFRIAFPDISEQRAISAILGSLDDKIDLNRRMNATLEETARALFKSWFVDFDPVRAGMEGRQPDGIDAETAALFPARLVESELGLIPEGWGTGSLSETIQIIGGGTPKTSRPEFWNGDIPWFSVTDLPSSGDVFVIDTDKKITQDGLNNSSTRILPYGTTIITARGTVGKLALVGVPMAMNQSCYGIAGQANYYTFFRLQSVISELQRNTHGTVFDTITRDTFDQIQFAIPKNEIIAHFESQVAPGLELMLTNLRQSRTLAATRDALLPRLLSGEVRVGDLSTYPAAE